MFAGGRLIASSAQRGYLPSIFGRLGSPFPFTRDLQAARDSMRSVGGLSATSQDSTVSVVSREDAVSTESLLGTPPRSKSSPESTPA